MSFSMAMAEGQPVLVVGEARTTTRGREARRTVLEAALAEVALRPIAEVQVQQIAERAGMSPARVLYYFPSRDQVLAAAFRHVEQDVGARRALDLAAVTDPRERLRRFVDLHVPTGPDDVSWKLCFDAWMRSPIDNEMTRTADEIDAAWLRDLDAIFADGVAVGAFSAAAAAQLRASLNVLLDGLAVHVLVGRMDHGQAVAMAMHHVDNSLT